MHCSVPSFLGADKHTRAQWEVKKSKMACISAKTCKQSDDEEQCLQQCSFDTMPHRKWWLWALHATLVAALFSMYVTKRTHPDRWGLTSFTDDATPLQCVVVGSAHPVAHNGQISQKVMNKPDAERLVDPRKRTLPIILFRSYSQRFSGDAALASIHKHSSGCSVDKH